MKNQKVFRAVLSPDYFKAVFFLASVIGVCPLTSDAITPYLKLLHIYAIAVILFDLFTEQRILRNKGRAILAVFALFYFITLLDNTNLINLSGLSNFAYLLSTLGLVYSYGKGSQRADRISGNLICWLITAANVVGIWMFFTKFYMIFPGSGYLGIFPYENRLSGMFGNPNVMGMVCMIGIFLSCTLFASGSGKGRYAYVLSGLINWAALLMSNSRTQIYSVTFAGAVFAFMQMLKGRKGWRAVGVASLAAVVAAAAVYGGGLLVQRGFSAVDVNYSYYLSQIDQGNHLAKPDTEPTGDPLEESQDPSEDPTEQTQPTLPSQTIMREDSGLNGRFEMWMQGVDILKAKPLFGAGLDNHNYTLVQLGKAPLPVKGNLHNVYLEVLVCCGIAGFGCLAAFLLIMLMNVIKFFRYNDGKTWTMGALLLASMAGFLLDGVADSTLVASVFPTAVAFWYMASQFAGLMEQENLRTGHHNPELLGKLADRIIARFSKK